MFSSGFRSAPSSAFSPMFIKARSFFSGPLNSVRMDSKDAQESLESGGGARCRCSNGRRKAVAVLVIQSLLTAACAAISIYFYLHHSSEPNKDKGIFLQSIHETEPKFSVIWNQEMHLKDNNKVNLSCGGPYIVYMWACVKSYDTSGIVNLTIEQGSRSIQLQSMQDTQECQETHSVVMLSEKSEFTITFKRDPEVYIKKLHLGLHYMLGAQCFKKPSPPGNNGQKL
ncbi:uncharacterized protein LOC127410407 [Myxocyprinus asiaticus]|uniref:uncharacterized protein LOC127410407 n=1 Tax=Myxocyprinus asiaticus TaxID=70543 RepID=UPI0022228F29|nr:uncharacterized protein LOC127410407 [Myxocyprinus asiaticus]